MSTLLRLSALLLLSTSLLAQQPERLRRADSFFGLHFDLHADLGIDNAGETLTEGMIDSLLTAVKPDFVQVDSKGHPGISSYPTRVGTPVPGFIRDPLRVWRDVTARHGVALYVHHSGVYDQQAVRDHPEWARVEGSRLVHVTVNRLGGHLAVNLVNAAGQHADRSRLAFDEIPPIGPLTVHLRLPSRPGRIRLEPEWVDLEFVYEEGVATVTVPRLEIHSILVVE